MDVASVDVIWNGFHQAKKIADLAETFEVNCAPHNYYCHLATFIAAQWCAAIPNARILEYDVDDVPWRDELVHALPEISAGELRIPDGPGWGVELNEDVLAAHPWPRALVPVGRERAEPALERQRQAPVATAELQPRELRELVAAAYGIQRRWPGLPEPRDLAARVPCAGSPQRARATHRPPRTSARRRRPSRRSAGTQPRSE